jgi:hypothetical protein
LLRHQQRLLVHALDQARAQTCPATAGAWGWEHCAERDRAGTLIDRHFGKQQLAGLRVLGTIVEDQLDGGLVRVCALQLAVGQLALQAQG